MHWRFSVLCPNDRLFNRSIVGRRTDDIQLVDTAAFSIAMDSMEARLYGKHNSIAFYMQSVRNFSIQEPEQYLEFGKYVRNILDWGKNAWSKNIRKAMVVARKKRDKKGAFYEGGSSPF